MQLQNIRFAGQRLIESYGDAGFNLSNGRFEGSILILPKCVEKIPAKQPSDLTTEMFDAVFEMRDDIEILILGTGTQQVFPHQKMRDAFLQSNIALEVMDSGAACRTYNILVSEDRRVAAAIIAV